MSQKSSIASGDVGSITLDQTSVSFTAVGQTQQLTGTMKDQDGATMTDASVVWTTNTPLVATVSSSRLATSTGSGSTAITDTSSSANHWRESVMERELMTGFLDNGSNPLSAITIRSLAELGYTVNAAAADAYAMNALLRTPGNGAAIRLKDDVFRFPIRVTGATGGTAGGAE